MRRVTSGLAVAVAFSLVGFGLTACATSEGESPAQSSAPASSGTPDKSNTASPAAVPTQEAVIVVAGADVDGLNVSASGYVAGVVENGGKCSFVFTRPDKRVESSRDAVANVVDTACGFVQIPIDQFSKGAWQVVLTYTSSDFTLTSTPTDLEIP